MNFLLSFIVFIPLCSALLLGVMYLYSIKVSKLSNGFFTFFALLAPLGSFLVGLFFFLQMVGNDEFYTYTLFRWLLIDGHDITFGFLADKLSIFMVLFITFVGWMIHIYASGYMRDDEGYGKFFFYFNLFLASMLLLVLGSGPLIMFMGWEGVGLCSYLLISYYFTDEANVQAGNKAFIANRIGDLGFVIGMSILLYNSMGVSFDFLTLQKEAVDMPLEMVTYACIALFLGAMAKSAQIPLYVWLPDAMAGPTPVSALIHAATMVTAGLYMVARYHFLFDLVSHIGLFIAYLGAFSSLFAAIIATKQSDIKKILAYSTMSQLGYMFIAVGLGSYGAGLFHVFTHAFFKALLFMGAGALIVALHHEQNIFKMGGMRFKTPLVYFTMLIANLAICGIPPFAGFFSKDEILMLSFASGHYDIWLIGAFTAFLTAYYMFRLFFVAFNGSDVPQNRHIISLPKVMTYPLVVLAFGSVVVGFLGIPEVLGGSNLISHWFSGFGHSLHVKHSTEIVLMGINILVALFGIAVAYKKFYQFSLKEVPTFSGVIWNKFYVDEFYQRFIIDNFKRLSTFIAYVVDIKIIDAFIMGLSYGFIKVGRVVATIQSGKTRYYAFFMLSGVSIISMYLLVVLG